MDPVSGMGGMDLGWGMSAAERQKTVQPLSPSRRLYADGASGPSLPPGVSVHVQ